MWAQQHPSEVVFGWESGWALSDHCCLPALTPRSGFQRVWPSAPSQMGPSLFIFVSPMYPQWLAEGLVCLSVFAKVNTFLRVAK